MRGGVPNRAAVACLWLGIVVAIASGLPSRTAGVAARPTKAGAPEAGARGITETVDEIMARDRTLSGAAPPSWVPRVEFDPAKKLESQTPLAAQASPTGSLVDGASSLTVPLAVGTSFKAIGQSESGFIPPDTAGDVGPSQILVHTNGRIRVYAKTGAPGALNATALSFWASVTSSSQPIFPQVHYDRLSARWILLAVNSVKPNNRVLIAVQTTPGTITSTSNFTFYQFDQASGGGGSDASDSCEAPKLGVDANALYIACNMITVAGALDRTTVYVVRKSSIIPGPGPLVVTAFRDISNGTLGPGPFAPTGVDNDDGQSTVGYVIGVDIATAGLLQIRRISDPGGTPALSANISLTVPATARPILQPASTSTTPLDGGDERLARASIHKNKLTGALTLFTSHGSEVDASCAGVVGGGRNGARWYEIGGSAGTPADPLGGTPSLLQSGTLCDPASVDPQGYIYPSIVATGQGNMAMGCTVASPNIFAGAAASGRSRLEPAGSTQAPTTLQSGLQSYTFVSNGRNRWGDYSFTSVDPGDDQTVWTFQEYADTPKNNWAVRAVQLRPPPPPAVSGLQGVMCAGNSSVALTVTGTADSPATGAEFFDPGADPGGPGYSGHLTAIATGGVTINGAPSLILPASPSTQPVLQVALSLNTTAATAGLKNITIRNPDLQATTGVGVIRVDQVFTPAAANNGPVCVGGTLQLSVPSATGGSYSWTGPNGFSSSLQNPMIGNVTAAAAGTYSVTITGTGCALPSGTTTVQVIPENAACEDGNACTSGDTCTGGSCHSGAPTICNDNSVCTADSCNPASGCVFTDTTAQQCGDGNGCTDDLCHPVSGCFYTNNSAPCNDQNACTTGDLCGGGTCNPGAPTNCDDSNICTIDGCDPSTGCSHTDISGSCFDDNPCTDDACIPATGCVFTNNTAPCSDGHICTTGDTCSGGACQPGAGTFDCTDNNPCTDDSCSPVTGCVHVNNVASCDDGNACTTGDVCSHQSCRPGTALVCNDNNVCTVDSCNPATGCVFTDNSAACNDGDACTADSCNPTSGCVHTDTSATCDDHNGCTDDSCNPATGCVHAANTSVCEDGDLCTTGDVCGDGVCHPGAAIVCDDQNHCTDDSCDPATGCVFTDISWVCDDGNVCTDETCEPAVGCLYAFNSGPCDDFDVCTTDEFCYEGGCTSITFVDCDDQSECTTDTCDAVTGCEHTYDPEVFCDDFDVCTIDDCDAQGCHYSPSSAPCEDGNPCSLGDTCAGGSCQPGPGTRDCNDGNPCTNDACNPLTGCVYSNNAASCDDGNACTTGDFCSHRNCLPGTSVSCNDNNVCTLDSCNPATGCVFTDNTAACSDGNVCTDDRCDAVTGCYFTNNTAPCDDGNICTAGDTCSAGACAGVPGPPSEVAGLSAAGRFPTTLSWIPLAGGAHYDIVTSTIGALQGSGTSNAACLVDNATGSSFVDPQATPPIQDGYYYLIRAQNQCGTGSYGFASSFAERVPTSACP